MLYIYNCRKPCDQRVAQSQFGQNPPARPGSSQNKRGYRSTDSTANPCHPARVPCPHQATNLQTGVRETNAEGRWPGVHCNGRCPPGG